MNERSKLYYEWREIEEEKVNLIKDRSELDRLRAEIAELIAIEKANLENQKQKNLI